MGNRKSKFFHRSLNDVAPLSVSIISRASVDGGMQLSQSLKRKIIDGQNKQVFLTFCSTNSHPTRYDNTPDLIIYAWDTRDSLNRSSTAQGASLHTHIQQTTQVLRSNYKDIPIILIAVNNLSLGEFDEDFRSNPQVAVSEVRDQFDPDHRLPFIECSDKSNADDIEKLNNTIQNVITNIMPTTLGVETELTANSSLGLGCTGCRG